VTATILTIIIFVASVNPGTFFERVVQHACLIPAGLLGTQLVVSLMKRWAVYSHPVITRLIDASLVIYLWHMVFVLFFGALFLRMQLGLWTASIATTMAAFACSWLVYLGVSRSRSLSLIFNGGPLRGK
jgi:glucan biosynthesis protein C